MPPSDDNDEIAVKTSIIEIFYNMANEIKQNAEEKNEEEKLDGLFKDMAELLDSDLRNVEELDKKTKEVAKKYGITIPDDSDLVSKLKIKGIWNKLTGPFRKVREKWDDLRRWVKDHKLIVVGVSAGVVILILAVVFLL